MVSKSRIKDARQKAVSKLEDLLAMVGLEVMTEGTGAHCMYAVGWMTDIHHVKTSRHLSTMGSS